MRFAPALRLAALPVFLLTGPLVLAQNSAFDPTETFGSSAASTLLTSSSTDLSLETPILPDDPALPQQGSPQLQNRPVGSSPPQSDLIAPNGKPYALVDGAVYHRPSSRDFFNDYAKDTYGLPALARTTIRALYAQARSKPTAWSDDFTGFGERFGSSAGITIISGNVRYAMELAFKEDLRYYPCHHCSVKAKIENSLLAEITARHDVDGHRFFTLTPTVADFSGPIIAHTIWYPGPNEGPLAGVISARTYFATRIGSHLFREFVLDRRHKNSNPEPARLP